jgi:hypothetical protein
VALVQVHEAAVQLAARKRGYQKRVNHTVAGEHGELVLVAEEDNRIYVTRGDKAKEFLRHLEIATLNDLGSDIEDEST